MKISLFKIYLFSTLNYKRPCVRINCYKNADWPNANKDEIDKAIKKCLEVFFFNLHISRFEISLLLKSLILFLKEIGQQK